MSQDFMKIELMLILLLFFVSLLAHGGALAQARDYLTDKEAELIRMNQQLDKRTKIYVDAVKRRIALLMNKKLSEKEVESFGLPFGDELDISSDIPRIISEAIDKIEDVAEKDPKNPLIYSSLRILADGCKEFNVQLEILLKKDHDQKRQGTMLSAIDYCQQVLEANERSKAQPAAPKK